MKNSTFLYQFPDIETEVLNKICADMGITMSALMLIFIKSVIINNAVVFDIEKALKASPVPKWIQGKNKMIKINSIDKEKFDKTIASLGYDKRAVIHAFLSIVVNEKRIPFEVRAEYKD